MLELHSRMATSFPYRQAGLWHRPIIPVTLKFKGKEFNYLALIDSGADFNIFHAELAKILGIDLKKKKAINFGGISKDGQQCRGYFVELKLKIKDEEFKTLVVFSDDISDNGYGILGQQGFFNHFLVEFDYHNKTITLESNKN